MMGDNRDDSTDSACSTRSAMCRSRTLSAVRVIYFSIGDGAAAWQVWRWPSALRWGRFFMICDEPNAKGKDGPTTWQGRAIRPGRAKQRPATAQAAPEASLKPSPRQTRGQSEAKPAKRRRRGTGEFEERIGYRFRDPALLEQALTHISALTGAATAPAAISGSSSGRSVLGLVVSDMLFGAFPGARRRGVVPTGLPIWSARRPVRTWPARSTSAPRYARRVGEQWRAAQPHRHPRHVCEALVGPRLGRRVPGCFGADRRLWEQRMRTPARPLRDAKTNPAGMAQGRGLPTPSYREVERKGPTPIRNSASRSSCPTARLPRAGPLETRRRAAARRRMLSREGVKRNEPMADRPADATASTRCGFVALIGAPNAGKSRSSCVGRHQGRDRVATRSDTRALVRGIAIDGGAQLIFVDTPGIFSPKRRLDRAMVHTAWAGAHDADIVGTLVDASAASTRKQARCSMGSWACGNRKCCCSTRSISSRRPRCSRSCSSERAGGFHGDLPDLGAHGRRRHRSQALVWPPMCRPGLALSGDQITDRADAPACRRDHA